MPKKTPRPRPLSGAGRGKGPGAPVFWGPVRPVTNSNEDDEDDHIVVRNRGMREQSAERWDEMEDMDDD